MANEYAVKVQLAQPRPIAAVRVRLPIRDVPRRFAEYLNQIYAAAHTGLIEVDGQNIFIYSRDANGEADVEFAVGAKKSFEPIGNVVQSATPSGQAATTTHWGDYALLGDAHRAVIEWCKGQGHSLAGPRWEVYGHWSEDPAELRTDIFYLLSP